MAGAARAFLIDWGGLTPGAIEAIKWTALLIMIGGHANAILFDRQWAWPNEIGRAAFPLFALAFGYGLSRVSAERRARVHARALLRLLLVGAIAAPLTYYAFHRGDFRPLNIMFTFAAGFSMVWLLQRGGSYGVSLATAILLLAGSVVEFMWPGVLLIVAMWASFARPGLPAQALVLACLLALWPVNGNAFALLVYPLVYSIALVKPRLARQRWVFYVGYPLHLAVLLAVAHLLGI